MRMGIDMNTEQERAAFEAWLGIKPCGAAHDFAWEAWKARAALQSQDREDAGMAEIMREAAQIIAAIPPEHAPDNIRWPIVDELEGFASKIGHARVAIKHDRKGRGEPVGEIHCRIYHDTEQHRDYLKARFHPDTWRNRVSFEWQEHRWAYRYTHFDDSGEYDLIVRTAPQPAEPSRGEPVACFKCGHAKHGGECVNVAPQPAEPVNKTDWNTVLSSWSDDDFVRVFHERPDLADRLRKMLSEPVKHKRQYAQGTALGEFGIIPMCDQVNDEPVKAPSDAISVVGVPEFDALMDHIYENGTASEGVLPLANAFARALLARFGNAARPDNCDEVNIAVFGE